MKKLFLVFGFVLAMAVPTAACLDAKSATTAVIDAALAACVAANADLGDSDLQKACKFADDLWPVIRQVLFGVKQGSAKLASKGLASPPALDAGK